MIGFLIYLSCSLVIAAMGVYALAAKKPVRFWANEKQPPNVADVSGYNHAMAKLWFIYAGGLLLCGLPLLAAQSIPLAMVTCLGTVFLTFAIIFKGIVIEEKYRGIY